MRALSILLLGLVLSGCAELGYYAQATDGQLRLLAARRDVAAVADDPATPAQRREALERTRSMRRFAVDKLGLPDNGSYTVYADLGRPYVVMAVFATPELSLKPKTWCFPMVGCLAYRGYFDAEAADELVTSLRAQGMDTALGPVPAYSSLGWFDDPLLNTFIDWPAGRVAELMFHELTHQRLYVAGDTAFNESLATVVGRAGARAWLEAHGSPAQRQAYERFLSHQAEFLDLVSAARQRLQTVYAADIDSDTMRRRKHDVFDELRRDYRALRDGPWEGYAGYDLWFEEGLNNARIAAVATYHSNAPLWQAALDRLDGDVPGLLAEAERLASLPKGDRLLALRAAGMPCEATLVGVSPDVPPSGSGENRPCRPARRSAGPL